MEASSRLFLEERKNAQARKAKQDRWIDQRIQESWLENYDELEVDEKRKTTEKFNSNLISYRDFINDVKSERKRSFQAAEPGYSAAEDLT